VGHTTRRPRATAVLTVTPTGGLVNRETVLEMNRLDGASALSRALSRATGAAGAAAWVEGFLRDNGELLVHTPELLEILDHWMLSLDNDRFLEILPLLRRTFATFPAGVRRNLGESLARGRSAATVEVLNERAQWVLPVLHQLLGLHVVDDHVAGPAT